MERGHLSDPDVAIIKLLLDLFHELTGEVVAFYDHHSEPIWCGDNSMSPLCDYSRRNPEIWKKCETDHKFRSGEERFTDANATKEELCHFGLCNYSIPVKLDNIFYGSLILGQKRSVSERDTGEIKFEYSLEELTIKRIVNSNQISNLREKRNKVEEVETLEGALKEKLIFLENAIEGVLLNAHKQIRKAAEDMVLVRHELHHPVTNFKNRLLKLVSTLETHLKTEKSDSPRHKTLEVIYSQIKYSQRESEIFSNTIENITESFGKDTRSIELREVNIVNLIEDAKSIFHDDAKIKGVHLEKVDASDLHYQGVQCDRGLMRRALINVFQNAVKYSYFATGNSSRNIRTRVFTKGTMWRLEVSNFGTGILQEEIESGWIWNKGNRGRLSSDLSRTGSGIGLAVIKQVVERHSGTVELLSVPLSDDKISGPYKTTLLMTVPFFNG